MKAAEELEKLGNRIWSCARTELYLAMPFLGIALDSLDYRMDRSLRTAGTDAVSIRYRADWVMREFADHPWRINRAYLHMLLHCIFRHMFSAGAHADGELWDLCCDLAVESVIDSMDCAAIAVTPSDFREEWYERLKSEVRVLTAEKLYRYFQGLKEDYMLRLRLIREFSVDEHSLWERMQIEPEIRKPPADGRTGSGEERNPAQEGSGEERNPAQEGSGEERNPAQEGSGEENHPETAERQADTLPMGSTDPKNEEWKKHAKRLRSDLETYEKNASEDTGSLTWMLRISTEVRRDYREFLKQFSVIREEARIDPDSFDYGFYHFGMEYYGNMPLIEENEYREARKVETLVIAIDTSASCRERLVQRFLNETAAILSSQESFFHKVQIRIIECDDQIQREEILTDLSQMKRYSEGFCMSGGYGTDFRPVFARVGELIQNGELKSLKGLLYFTDGFGSYPARPPSCQTAFVFSDEEENNAAEAPSWAIRLFMGGRKDDEYKRSETGNQKYSAGLSEKERGRDV